MSETTNEITSGTTSEIVQLIYASRARFPPSARGSIEPEVGRILTQSRRNNSNLQVGGALYYGDGLFFQCLEGERAVVDTLYRQIQTDPRHTAVVQLLLRPVQERQFPSWSMKYVPTQESVRRLLKNRGYPRFDPYRFDSAMIDDVLGLFAAVRDPTGNAQQVKTGAFAWLQNRQTVRLAVAGAFVVLALSLAAIALL